MTRPVAPAATARTFSAELAKRTRNSGLAFSVVVFLGCPTWRVFDQILDPQAAPGFWPIRLVVSGLTLAVWIPALIVRSRPRLALLATMATASSVQVAVAWMLLQTTIAFDTYLLCLILGPICTGALIQWHWRYPLALVAITVAALGVMSLAGTRQLTERNLVTTLFVLCTTSILVGIGHYISYQVSYREFTARKDAEHARAAAEQARIEAESQRERNLILLAEVEQLSREDALTGIANRRAFDEALAREIARADRNGNSFGLIMLDVDHFKHLNDTFGHQSGDAVLHTLAQRLVNAVRGADLVARFGGEEFAVILVDTREEDLADAAESVRARMVTTTDDGRNSVTASAGAALYPRHGHDATSLIAAADAALYTAKAAGRNCCIVAAPVAAR